MSFFHVLCVLFPRFGWLPQVPLRIWLLAVYLGVLHILVMVSFTHSNGLSKLQACEQLIANGGGSAAGHVTAAVAGHVLP